MHKQESGFTELVELQSKIHETRFEDSMIVNLNRILPGMRKSSATHSSE